MNKDELEKGFDMFEFYVRDSKKIEKKMNSFKDLRNWFFGGDVYELMHAHDEYYRLRVLYKPTKINYFFLLQDIRDMAICVEPALITIKNIISKIETQELSYYDSIDKLEEQNQ